MKTTFISMAINVSRCQMANGTIEAAKARQRGLFWKKLYTKIYRQKKSKNHHERSLPGFSVLSPLLGQWNLKHLRFWSQPSWHRWCSFAAARGARLGSTKSPKNLYERLRRSCELLENLPFKQWFSYLFDCWVPEKSLQILISGIFVAKNDGNVHLDGSWINILIMLCDLGKKSRLPSLKLQIYPLKLMVGFSEISFGLFSGAKM